MRRDRASARGTSSRGGVRRAGSAASPAIRPSTSASQACGSTWLSLVVPMSVYIATVRAGEQHSVHFSIALRISTRRLRRSVGGRPFRLSGGSSLSSTACSMRPRYSRSSMATIATRIWSSIQVESRRFSSGTSFPGSAKRRFSGSRSRAEIVVTKGGRRQIAAYVIGADPALQGRGGFPPRRPVRRPGLADIEESAD